MQTLVCGQMAFLRKATTTLIAYIRLLAAMHTLVCGQTAFVRKATTTHIACMPLYYHSRNSYLYVFCIRPRFNDKGPYPSRMRAHGCRLSSFLPPFLADHDWHTASVRTLAPGPLAGAFCLVGRVVCFCFVRNRAWALDALSRTPPTHTQLCNATNAIV
jgi:hypothetical protein